MNTIEKVTELKGLQDELNILTCGKDWRESICTSKGGTRNTEYELAIITESTELIDSLNWKHWKDVDGKDDLDNLFLEYIDILHFVLSLELIYAKDETLLANRMYEVKNTEMSSEDVIEAALDMIAISIIFRTKNDNITALIKTFVKLTNVVLGFTGKMFKDIYDLYITKYALNIVRSKNGYSDGSYKKTWLGREDNVIAMELMHSGNVRVNDVLSKELLVNALQSVYETEVLNNN